jgi:hypothetical protein
VNGFEIKRHGQRLSFKFNKRTEYFIGPDDETPSVAAVRVNNPDRSPSESRAETQPKLHPALLSLSAMISQYFTRNAVLVYRLFPAVCGEGLRYFTFTYGAARFQPAESVGPPALLT